MMTIWFGFDAAVVIAVDCYSRPMIQHRFLLHVNAERVVPIAMLNYTLSCMLNRRNLMVLLNNKKIVINIETNNHCIGHKMIFPQFKA